MRLTPLWSYQGKINQIQIDKEVQVQLVVKQRQDVEDKLKEQNCLNQDYIIQNQNLSIQCQKTQKDLDEIKYLSSNFINELKTKQDQIDWQQKEMSALKESYSSLLKQRAEDCQRHMNDQKEFDKQSKYSQQQVESLSQRLNDNDKEFQRKLKDKDKRIEDLTFEVQGLEHQLSDAQNKQSSQAKEEMVKLQAQIFQLRSREQELIDNVKQKDDLISHKNQLIEEGKNQILDEIQKQQDFKNQLYQNQFQALRLNDEVMRSKNNLLHQNSLQELEQNKNDSPEQNSFKEDDLAKHFIENNQVAIQKSQSPRLDKDQIQKLLSSKYASMNKFYQSYIDKRKSLSNRQRQQSSDSIDVDIVRTYVKK